MKAVLKKRKKKEEKKIKCKFKNFKKKYSITRNEEWGNKIQKEYTRKMKTIVKDKEKVYIQETRSNKKYKQFKKKYHARSTCCC